jgi:transposase
MAKRIRRRERHAPTDGQLGLSLATPTSDSAQPRPRGPVDFKVGKRRMFVGTQPLDQYLEDARLGWVVRMRTLLEQVDLSAFTARYEGTGRRPYHPRVILGLILYGMLEKKWSLRELEVLSARDVGAWWICGGLRVDHSTIGRFLTRHDDLVTEEFFVALTRTIVGQLRIKGGNAVIDGTVIEAAASHLAAMKIEALGHASERAREEARAKPDDDDAARRATELEQAVKVCEERNAQREAKNRVGAGAQVVPAEPEAVVQKQKNGSTRPSYKPSMIVHESGLVLGHHVDPTSETAAVVPLVQQHREILGEAPRCTMMDAGFFTAFVLAYFVEQDLDVLCPSGRALNEASMTRCRRNESTRFLKSEFTYDEQRDVYICPARRLLVLEHVSHDAHGAYRRYRGEACADCPLKARCTTAAARTLKRYDADELKDAMIQVMRQPQAKRRFRRRSCGERPFAGIKTRQGLTRFHRRGLRGARLETALHFAAWNIRVALGRLALVQIELWARQAGCSSSWRRVATIILVIPRPRT